MRTAVEALPRHTRIAMLEGIRRNRIIAGGYSDRDSGGVCPMLAAHRNGGRTDLASFARSWDRFTGAKRPRRATKREVMALKSYIELSLLHDDIGQESIRSAAKRIRAERAAAKRQAKRDIATAIEHVTTEQPVGAPATDRNRTPELRLRRRWSWLIPTRRYDVFTERVAAASEQLAEQHADDAGLGREAEKPASVRDLGGPTARTPAHH
jgi:hypothetical protein